MKADYIIWLESGESINGRAEESNIDYLIGKWRKWHGPRKTVFLTDDDGVAFFRLSEIEAIAKNHPEDMERCGF